MAEIITFPGLTSLDIEPDEILEQAKGKLQVAIVCGVDADGNQYLSSSVADGGQIIWQLERAKHLLMCIADEYNDE